MIFNGCEVRIENSITRIFVLHHEACQAMPNSYPEWQNFQFAQNDQIWISFLAYILHLSLNVLFYQFNAKISTFATKKCSLQLLSWVDGKTFCGKWRQKLTSKVKKLSWRHARESTYTLRVRQHFLALVTYAEFPVKYARKPCCAFWCTGGFSQRSSTFATPTKSTWLKVSELVFNGCKKVNVSKITSFFS